MESFCHKLCHQLQLLFAPRGSGRGGRRLGLGLSFGLGLGLCPEGPAELAQEQLEEAAVGLLLRAAAAGGSAPCPQSSLPAASSSSSLPPPARALPSRARGGCVGGTRLGIGSARGAEGARRGPAAARGSGSGRAAAGERERRCDESCEGSQTRRFLPGTRRKPERTWPLPNPCLLRGSPAASAAAGGCAGPGPAWAQPALRGRRCPAEPRPGPGPGAASESGLDIGAGFREGNRP